MILKASIEKLMRGENLKDIVCQQALEEMLDPTINPLQIAAFLVLLRAKKETADELSAIINALRAKMLVVPTDHAVLDIVGPTQLISSNPILCTTTDRSLPV